MAAVEAARTARSRSSHASFGRRVDHPVDSKYEDYPYPETPQLGAGKSLRRDKLPGEAVTPEEVSPTSNRSGGGFGRSSAGFYEVGSPPVNGVDRGLLLPSEAYRGSGHRRRSSTTIGRVSGLPGHGKGLRGVAPVKAAAAAAPLASPPKFLGLSAVDRETVASPPPELAEKLLALVEKLVTYKDRLAQERAARKALEAKLRDVHLHKVAPLKAEIQALEDIAIQTAEGQIASALKTGGMESSRFIHGDPMHYEAVQQAEQLGQARAARTADPRHTAASSSSREGPDVIAVARKAQLARRGLGGGEEGDLALLPLTPELQAASGVSFHALGQARAAAAAREMGSRAQARAVLLEGALDPEGSDVVGAAISAGILDPPGALTPEATLAPADAVEVDEVQAALSLQESAEFGGPMMSYARWLEKERAVAAHTIDVDAGGGGVEEGRGVRAWFEAKQAAYAWAGWAGWAGRRAAAGTWLPMRTSLERVAGAHGSSVASSFSLHRRVVLLFLLQAVISVPFALYHWSVGALKSGAGAGVAASALQAFLPSSYVPAESSVLTAHLVLLFGVAVGASLGWLVVADRRRKAYEALEALQGIAGPRATSVSALSNGTRALSVPGKLVEEAAVVRFGAWHLGARRVVGTVFYLALLLWVLYLTSQLMLASSMVHRVVAGTGVGGEGAEASGAAWVEVITPAGCTVVLALMPTAVSLISTFEAWTDDVRDSLAALRLWLAFLLVALLQVLGYLLVADPTLMRAPLLAVSDAFPSVLKDAESVFQQLVARFVLARPFYPSLLPGGTACRLDAAAAGLWRLFVAQAVVDRVATLLWPFAVSAARAVGCRRSAPPASTSSPGSERDSLLHTEHDPAVTVAATCRLAALGLACQLFSPLASILVLCVSLAAWHADVFLLHRSVGKAGGRPLSPSGRATVPIFYLLLTVTCVVMGSLHAAVISSESLPRSCRTTILQGVATAGSSSPLSRGGDPYCTAVVDTFPLLSTLHGWERTGLSLWETTSPWVRSAATLPLVGTLPVQRRQLVTSVAGEEVGWWLDHVCVPTCEGAQVAYRASRTGSEPDVASDVMSDSTWCASHCSSFGSILPLCPLALRDWSKVNPATGELLTGVTKPAPSFQYRWPVEYSPADKSSREQPFGLAAETATTLTTGDVTHPCDLACGAWVHLPSGLAALKGAFSASPFSTFLWAVAYNPMVLWVSILLSLTWGCTQRNSAAVAGGLASHRTAIVGRGMAALQRHTRALQTRLRAYKAQIDVDEKLDRT